MYGRRPLLTQTYKVNTSEGRLNSIGNISFVGLFYYLRKKSLFVGYCYYLRKKNNSLFVGYCSCDNCCVVYVTRARQRVPRRSAPVRAGHVRRRLSLAGCRHQRHSPPVGDRRLPVRVTPVWPRNTSDPPELRAPGLTVRGAHLPQVVGRGGPCDVGAPAGTSCPRDRRR